MHIHNMIICIHLFIYDIHVLYTIYSVYMYTILGSLCFGSLGPVGHCQGLESSLLVGDSRSAKDQDP